MTQPNYPPPGDPNAPGPQGGYPPGGYPPQFYVQPRKTNSLALTAMIVSIVCLVISCWPVGIVGAIMGHKAKAQIRQTGEDGDGMATAGIVIGWIQFALFVLAIIAFGVIIAISAASGGLDSSSSY